MAEGQNFDDVALMAHREQKHDERMELFATLEKRIGIPKGFLWDLRNELDDWAYIVKLAVICEAALTHALVLAIKNVDLLDHFSDLTQASRLNLARQFSVISDEDRHTLGVIAQVRNSFAHRVENLGGSLKAYYESRPRDHQVDMISKLVQLEVKPNKDADMHSHTPFFKLLLFASAMKPLQSIAYFGLTMDKAVEEERQKSIRTLNDLFSGDRQGDDWWYSDSNPVGVDTPLVLKEAAKHAERK